MDWELILAFVLDAGLALIMVALLVGLVSSLEEAYHQYKELAKERDHITRKGGTWRV